jgi:multicomponent Na+:H+ antiporter subunit E
MRRIVVFVIAYVTWLLLVFPYDSGRVEAGLDSPWDLQSVLLGAGAAALVALVLPSSITDAHGLRWLNPARWFWALVYLPVFTYYVVKANLEVVYLVLHPEMPIRPGIVKVKTGLKSTAARVALANSITLTPGTFTVDIDEDEGALYVHWLAVKAEDEEGATREIVSRFEPYLRRIFD